MQPRLRHLKRSIPLALLLVAGAVVVPLLAPLLCSAQLEEQVQTVADYLAAGDVEGADTAMSILRVAASDSPERVVLLRNAADAYQKWGYSFRALGEYEALRTGELTEAEARSLDERIVSACISLGDFDEVDARLTSFLAEHLADPDSVFALARLAGQLARAGEPARAALLYETLLSAHPGHPDAYEANQRLMDLYRAEGDAEGLAAAQERVVTLRASLRVWAEETLATGRRPAKVLQAARRLLEIYRAPQNLPGANRVRRQAIARCQELMWKNPESPAVFSMVRDLIRHNLYLGQTAEAEAWLELFGELHGDHPRYLRELCLLGEQFRTRGQYETAAAICREALALNPPPEDAFEVQAALVGSLAGAGRGEEAEAEAPELLRLAELHPAPDQKVFLAAEAFFQQGDDLMERGREQEARESFARARVLLEASRTRYGDTHYRSSAMYLEAEAHRLLGEPAEAIAGFEALLAAYPGCKRPWLARHLIARCHEQLLAEGLSTPRAVKAAYQALVDNHPESPPAAYAARRAAENGS